MTSFGTFFEGWLSEQNQHLHRLTKIVSERNHVDVEMGGLVEQVVKHYESYYEAKSRCAEHNVLTMLSPPWRSSLEDAFLWIGGWRPSMAFHLLYAKAGMQLKAQMGEMIQGLTTADLSDLSQCQLARVDKLQQGAIKQEKHITHKMAKLQETVADIGMVELSHVEVTGDDGGDNEKAVESTLASKKKQMKEILNRADELRLRTLKNITQILTPIQAVHFLIAAAELHLKLHAWGKKLDDDQ